MPTEGKGPGKAPQASRKKMRSEEEIRAALALLDRLIISLAAGGRSDLADHMVMTSDALQWVVGDESAFADVLDESQAQATLRVLRIGAQPS